MAIVGFVFNQTAKEPAKVAYIAGKGISGNCSRRIYSRPSWTGALHHALYVAMAVRPVLVLRRETWAAVFHADGQILLMPVAMPT